MGLALGIGKGYQFRRRKPPEPSFFKKFGTPAAAYSLRDLSGSNPNVIEVRRSSDNAVEDFTASEITNGTLAAWVGAGNDGFVRTWYDQADANDATQATASSQPKIVDAGSLVTENGKAAIDFDGVDDQLTNSFGTTYNQPTYTFVVHNFTSAPSVFDGLIGSIGTEHRLILSATLNYTIQAGGALQYNGYSTDQSLISYKMQQSDPKFFFNGTQQSVTGGTSIGATGLQGIVLGGITSGSGSGNTPVQIQELIIFDSDQSANRTAIEANINDHYSIY